MFYQIFFSPSVIITNKHGTLLPQELLNDLRLRIFENQENLKTSKNYSSVCKSSSQNESFVNTSKKLLKNRN